MATIRQKKVVEKIVESHGTMSVSSAMREVGYTEASAKNPSNLTNSKAWKELMDEYLSDEKLTKKHNTLLNATKMEHMVFPLGPKDEDDINFSGARTKKLESTDEDADPEAHMPEEHKERTTLTDAEIIAMLAEVNCKVRRIVHGETARHVYFWAADNMAQDKALDKAYKLKGSYAPDKSIMAKIDLTPKDPSDKASEDLAAQYEEQLKQSLYGATGTGINPPLDTEVQDQE